MSQRKISTRIISVGAVRDGKRILDNQVRWVGQTIFSPCDPAGTRTQGPNIKSVVLYQLSYEIA
jgi:hypothetical protein